MSRWVVVFLLPGGGWGVFWALFLEIFDVLGGGGSWKPRAGGGLFSKKKTHFHLPHVACLLRWIFFFPAQTGVVVVSARKPPPFFFFSTNKKHRKVLVDPRIVCQYTRRTRLEHE